MYIQISRKTENYEVISSDKTIEVIFHPLLHEKHMDLEILSMRVALKIHSYSI